MSSVGNKGIVILDRDGEDSVTVTDGKLDVNIAAPIDLTTGDINVELDHTTDTVGTFEQHTLVPHQYDYIELSYTDGDLTDVRYKTGGSGGTIVATLTLAYTDSVLQSVTKT